MAYAVANHGHPKMEESKARAQALPVQICVRHSIGYARARRRNELRHSAQDVLNEM